MTDFHCHFLPGIDDGAADPETAYEMLRVSSRQGVDTVVATPHYDPAEESPEEFLKKRAASLKRLSEYADARRAAGTDEPLPKLLLGAEVYFFPTISDCESIAGLAFGAGRYLLVEPPMVPWSEAMLDELQLCGENFGLTPVIAHVDRYARLLKDKKLFRRLAERGIPAQVNASFFLYRESAALAVRELKAGRIAFLGSDAHDLEGRRPNLHSAVEAVSANRRLAPLMDSLIASADRQVKNS